MSPVTVPNVAIDRLALAPAAQEFCNRNGLTAWVPTALDLVSRHFDLAGAVRLSVRDDPEVDERLLEIEVPTRGEPDEAVKAYNRFVDAWIQVAPAPVRDRVRLVMGVSD